MKYLNFVYGFVFFLLGVLFVDLICLLVWGPSYFETSVTIFDGIFLSTLTSLMRYIPFIVCLGILSLIFKDKSDITKPRNKFFAGLFIVGILFQGFTVLLTKFDIPFLEGNLSAEILVPIFVFALVFFFVKRNFKSIA